MRGKQLILGALAPAARQTVQPRRLLSLSGGGFRGLFTAQVLERMEAQAGTSLRNCFDLIGGASIGGILAIGLAAGIPAATMREEFEAWGPKIFRPRLLSLDGFLSAQYSPKPLRQAIEAILGEQASAPFARLPARVAVVAIDQKTAAPRIFKTDRLAPGTSATISSIDVALSTSAAPTFFPPHHADGTTFVDGGLIANAPDLVVATEALRHFAVGLDSLSVCAVGTAGNPRKGVARPGKIRWIARHDLIPLTIDAQALLAATQLQRLIPSGILRFDAAPTDPMPLADASPITARRLIALANETFDAVHKSDAAALQAFLAHRL